MRHLTGWFLWLVGYWFIRFPLIIVGMFVFPLAYYTRRRDDSLRLIFWVFDNEEDGIYGAPFWISKHDGKRNFWTAYTWSAWRNPVNNMRFTRFGLNRDAIGNPEYQYWGDQEIPTPALARVRPKHKIWHYSLVRSGRLWYPSFWYIFPWGPDKHFRIRLGWKCTYKWINDDNLSPSGKYSGMTFQLLPYRNG